MKKTSLIKKLSIVLMLFTSMVSYFATANEWEGNFTITNLRIDSGSTYIAFDRQPHATCSNWGEYLKLDHLTESGKPLFAALLAAKANKIKIQIWYTASSAPNTDQSTGCTGATIGKLTGIRILN